MKCLFRMAFKRSGVRLPLAPTIASRASIGSGEEARRGAGQQDGTHRPGGGRLPICWR